MGVPYEQTLGAARDRARKQRHDADVLVVLGKIEDHLRRIAEAQEATAVEVALIAEALKAGKR